MFEYACHEGNYAMRNILTGARADEKAEAGRRFQPCRRTQFEYGAHAMKRFVLITVAAALVAGDRRTSAMIPEQVKHRHRPARRRHRHRAADRARVQRHSVCRAAAWREPLEGAAAGGEVGRRAQGRCVRCAVRAPVRGRRRSRRWRAGRGAPARTGAAAPAAAAPAAPAAPPREPARSEDCLYAQRLDQREQRQRPAPGDGVDLRRRLHRRIRRPRLV